MKKRKLKLEIERLEKLVRAKSIMLSKIGNALEPGRSWTPFEMTDRIRDLTHDVRWMRTALNGVAGALEIPGSPLLTTMPQRVRNVIAKLRHTEDVCDRLVKRIQDLEAHVRQSDLLCSEIQKRHDGIVRHHQRLREEAEAHGQLYIPSVTEVDLLSQLAALLALADGVEDPSGSGGDSEPGEEQTATSGG